MLAPLLLSSLALGKSALLGADGVKFARTYKPGTSSTYGMQMTMPRNEVITCDITAKVLELKGESAKVDFTMSNVKAPKSTPLAIAKETTSLMGPNSLPTDFKNGDGSGGEAYIFLLIGGIAPNQNVEVGKTVNLDWQDDAKDLKFSGTGKIQSIDTTTHKMNVAWTLTMAPAPNVAVGLKIASVYSTDDFSLIHSDYSMAVNGQAMTFVLNRR